MRSLCSLLKRWKRLLKTPLFAASASSRFSRTVCFGKTVGRWNFRPMPRRAIWCSFRLVRSSMSSKKKTWPVSGLVLPVTTSMSVVLPAPLGPMMQRSSPESRMSVRFVSALKPSKLTEMSSTQSSACWRAARISAPRSLGTRWLVRSGGLELRGLLVEMSVTVLILGSFVGTSSGDTFSDGGASAKLARAEFGSGGMGPLELRQVASQAHQAIGQGEGHDDEQRAQEEQPQVRRSGREVALGAVDDERANHRAHQRAATADGDPDDGFNRVGGLHLARVDDADLRNVESPGYPAQKGGQRPGEPLVGERVVARKARFWLVVAHRAHHDTELALGEVLGQEIEAGEDADADDVQDHLGRRLADRIAVQVLEIGQAVVAAEARLVAEEQEHGGERQRLGDDREVDALDARAERQIPEETAEDPWHDHAHGQREPEVVEAVPVRRQLLPIEEHHELGQVAGVDAAFADRAHQVHAHGVAAEREEDAVTEAQDAAKPPD